MAKKVIRRGRIYKVTRNHKTNMIRGRLRAIPSGADIEFVPVSNKVFKQYDIVEFALTKGNEAGMNKKAIILKKVKEGRKR